MRFLFGWMSVADFRQNIAVDAVRGAFIFLNKVAFFLACHVVAYVTLLLAAQSLAALRL